VVLRTAKIQTIQKKKMRALKNTNEYFVIVIEFFCKRCKS
jgi:hypothetical protein